MFNFSFIKLDPVDTVQDLVNDAQKSFDLGNFDDSIKKMKQVLNLTDDNDENITIYRGNIVRAKAAKANFEGKKLMIQGDASAAVEKFKQALEILEPHQSNFSNDNQQYVNNLAKAYDKRGHEEFNKLNFVEAKKFYNLAIGTKSSNADVISSSKKGLKEILYTQIEHAKKLNLEGLQAFDRGDFLDAATKFSMASSLVDKNHETRKQYISNLKRAEANSLNKEGEIYLKEEKFREALKKFHEANEKLKEAKNTTSDNIEDSFEQNLDRAQAVVHNLDGLALRANGDFVAAIKKFNEALKVLPNTESSRKVAIKNYLADTHNDNGQKLLNSGKFEDSLQQFKLAVSNSSNDNPNFDEITKKLKLAEFEVAYAKSKSFFNEGIFDEALEDLDSAMEILPHEKEHLRPELIKLKATELHAYGDELFKGGFYLEANEKYEESRALTNNQSLKLELTTKIKEAQINFFENSFESEIINQENLSDEVAAQRLTKILELFISTINTNEAKMTRMADKLLEIMKELTKRRVFKQVFRAVELGNKLFPDRKKDYNEVLNATKKLKANPTFLKDEVMKNVGEEKKKNLSATKFMENFPLKNNRKYEIQNSA